MGNFKMKAPYKFDPISIHEVPFDDPNLMGKANKNGTIIMNKDQARDPQKREKIKRHEKHHLKEMLLDKNPDGTPVLDYDDENVSYKGVKHPRSEFDEGNKSLPWEKEAYGADKDIDFSGGKLKSAGPNMMGSKHGKTDEDEVSMGESFGPAAFMKGYRGKSNPFKFMADQGLLSDNAEDGINGGPSSYGNPKAIENAGPIDTSSWEEGVKNITKNVTENLKKDEEVVEKDPEGLNSPFEMNGPAEKCPPGPEGDDCRKAKQLAQTNMESSDWTVDPDNPNQEIRSGSGTINTPGSDNTTVIPKAKEGSDQATDKDKYIESLRSRFPNSSRQDLIDSGYVSATWGGDWTDPVVTAPTTVTQNVNEVRNTTIPKTTIPDGDIPDSNIPDGDIPDNDTDTSKKKKNKIFNIGLNRNKKSKNEETKNRLFCKKGSTDCGKEGNVNATVVKNKGKNKRPSQGSARRKANRQKRRYARRGGRY